MKDTDRGEFGPNQIRKILGKEQAGPDEMWSVMGV